MNFSGIKDRLKSLYIIEFTLVIIGIILRIKLYLYNNSFFIDECTLGYNIITKKYFELFLPLDIYQSAPPLFLVISKFILDISHQTGNIYTQDLALRVFPLCSSIVALPLFAIFLNKISNNKIFIWLCLAILSLNHCAIEYGAQFKQYSTELMFTLILLLTFFHFDINKLTKKTSIIYSIILCISIWLSNMSLVLLGTGALYFSFKSFSKEYREDIKSNLRNLSIIGILFILNAIIYYFCYFKGQINSETYAYMHHFWTNLIPGFFTLDNFSQIYTETLREYIEINIIPLFQFTLFNVIIFFFVNKKFDLKTKFFIAVPILISIIACFLHIYPFSRKFTLFLIPLFLIVYFQFIYMIVENNFTKLLAIIILAMMTITRFQLPISSVIFNKNPIRNTVDFIIKNKIPANKVIFSSQKCNIYYYTSTIYSQEQPLLYDIIWRPFKDSKIPQLIKDAQIGDYYIFAPFNDIYADYNTNLIKCLNNKHIKILDTYSYKDYKNEEWFYIIHLKKISNY